MLDLSSATYDTLYTLLASVSPSTNRHAFKILLVNSILDQQLFSMCFSHIFLGGVRSIGNCSGEAAQCLSRDGVPVDARHLSS